MDPSGTARTRAPVRLIDSLAASRVEISFRSFGVTRQAYGMPRNKTRGDELSSGGQRWLREGSPFGTEPTKLYKSRTTALHAMYTARSASNTCKFYMFQGRPFRFITFTGLLFAYFLSMICDPIGPSEVVSTRNCFYRSMRSSAVVALILQCLLCVESLTRTE